MMRKSMAVLLAMTLVTGATAAQAGNMTFGLHGDAGLPIGDFSKVPDVSSSSSKPEIGEGIGFGGGVFGDYWIKDSYALGVDINGQFLSAKSDMKDFLNKYGPNSPTTGSKLTTNVISFCGHGVWALPTSGSSFQPWLMAGAGLYNIAGKFEDDSPGSKSDGSLSKFGFNVGAGADLKAGSSMKWGAQVRYDYVPDGLDPKMFDLPSSTFDKGALSQLTFGLNLMFMTSGAQ